MTINIGDKIIYYPVLADSRRFPFVVTEGDSYPGAVRSVTIEGLINIIVDATPRYQALFNRIPLLDAVPENPTQYGFAVRA